MAFIRQKILFLFMLLCLGGILCFSSQASGFVCSPEPTDDLIKYGDLVTCNIEPIGDIDKFRFSGVNGDTIAVQAIRQGSVGSPCIELFDPDGGLIDSKCGTARIDVTLDQTGTHTILVTEWNNSSTLDYGLALERIDPHSASATPINPGELLSDVIDPVGDMDLFFFQGVNGDTIAVQAIRQGSVGSPCIELFDPDGGLIDSKCGTARIDVTLDQTGTHTILVTEWNNSSTLDYGLALERIDPHSASATPINPGELLSDVIDPVGDMDLFFFQGVNGDTIAVQAIRQGSVGSPCIELFDPDGGLIDSKCGIARIDVTLDQTGTHTILVTEWNNSSTLDYGLAYECIGDCPPVPPPVIGTFFYFPVTPCRIVDTRKGGGIIGASVQRNFRVYGPGSVIGPQGGNAAGCSSPYGEPYAAHINMVAVNPTGKGNLQAFPVGAGTGAGLSVNYNTIDTNLANAGTVKAITGTGPDITVASNFSSAHTVIDVLGYYYPDEGFYYTPVDPCRIVDTRNTSAGIIDASTQRDFHVYGSGGTISAQGGDPDGCPSTLGVFPEAAHINMVAVNPTGKGNLQAFPVGAGTGAGLSVNYNTIDTNLANAGTVKAITGTGPDITVASNFSSAHTAIDVLGYYSEEEDLLYTPVTPCRIVDTRNTSAGMIGASTQRNFRVFGSGGTISAQGGDSAGCLSPRGEPYAAHINMVAVNPTGKGNLQAFPVGAGTGAGLSVNYNTIDTNLANAGTVKTVIGVGPDISVASNYSSAHTAIDVLGYYYPAP